LSYPQAINNQKQKKGGFMGKENGWYYCNISPEAKIGKYTVMGSFVCIDKDAIIGEYCNLHNFVYVSGGVKIGNRVFVGPGTVLLNDKYPPSGGQYWYPPIIEDDVIIGGGCVILPGIVLRKGCKIGAGSVVTKSVEAGDIVAGNPAKSIRKKVKGVWSGCRE